jgi:translation initiation factor eIF-2B subunit delta
MDKAAKEAEQDTPAKKEKPAKKDTKPAISVKEATPNSIESKKPNVVAEPVFVSKIFPRTENLKMTKKPLEQLI